jgi:hypothetical protein
MLLTSSFLKVLGNQTHKSVSGSNENAYYGFLTKRLMIKNRGSQAPRAMK